MQSLVFMVPAILVFIVVPRLAILWSAPRPTAGDYIVKGGTKYGHHSNAWPAASITLRSEAIDIEPSKVVLQMPRHVPTWHCNRDQLGAIRLHRRLFSSRLYFEIEGHSPIAVIPPNWNRFYLAWRGLGWPEVNLTTTTFARSIADRVWPRLGVTRE